MGRLVKRHPDEYHPAAFDLNQATFEDYLVMGMAIDPKPKKKEPKLTKKQSFFIRYSLTQESLIYKNRPISDAIALKAHKFIELNCIEAIGANPKQPGQEIFICKLIPGYNQTTYTMLLTRNRDWTVSCCNCQYGLKARLCSHQLALFLIEDVDWSRNLEIVKGVRKKPKKGVVE